MESRSFVCHLQSMEQPIAEGANVLQLSGTLRHDQVECGPAWQAAVQRSHQSARRQVAVHQRTAADG